MGNWSGKKKPKRKRKSVDNNKTAGASTASRQVSSNDAAGSPRAPNKERAHVEGAAPAPKPSAEPGIRERVMKLGDRFNALPITTRLLIVAAIAIAVGALVYRYGLTSGPEPEPATAVPDIPAAPTAPAAPAALSAVIQNAVATPPGSAPAMPTVPAVAPAVTIEPPGAVSAPPPPAPPPAAPAEPAVTTTAHPAATAPAKAPSTAAPKPPPAPKPPAAPAKPASDENPY